MKWILAFIASALSFSVMAACANLDCKQAKPTSDPDFCSSFKSVAVCHCIESGMPKGKCQNMNIVYQLMMARFGSIKKACEYQHDTDTQTCIDDWTCYRSGGRDSKGQLCSSSGNACSN